MNFRRVAFAAIATFAFFTFATPDQPLADGVMPTMNVSLRFLCLSVADPPGGEINTRSLSELLPVAPPDSVVIQSQWRPGSNAALDTISTRDGASLAIRETIATPPQCAGLPNNKFSFAEQGDDLKAAFCLTAEKPSVPPLHVEMTLHGPDKASATSLMNRVSAVSLCYPKGGLNALYEGVELEREVLRMKR